MKEPTGPLSDEVLQSDDDLEDDSEEDFVISKSKRRLKE